MSWLLLRHFLGLPISLVVQDQQMLKLLMARDLYLNTDLPSLPFLIIHFIFIPYLYHQTQKGLSLLSSLLPYPIRYKKLLPIWSIWSHQANKDIRSFFCYPKRHEAASTRRLLACFLRWMTKLDLLLPRSNYELNSIVKQFKLFKTHRYSHEKQNERPKDLRPTRLPLLLRSAPYSFSCYLYFPCLTRRC